MVTKTLTEMMDILMAELVKELRAQGRDEGLCVKSIYPGNSVPADYGMESCGGMAYLRLTSANPSVSFPEQDNGLDNCTHTLAYSVEMGIFRTLAVPTQNSRNQITLPSEEDNTKAAHEQYQDIDIMHRAIQNAAADIDMLILGAYAPLGPEGGIHGGAFTVTIGADF